MSDEPFDARLAELNAMMDRTMSRREAASASLRADEVTLRRDILAELARTRSDIMGKQIRLGDCLLSHGVMAGNCRGSVDLGHEALARHFRAFVVVRLAGRQFDLHRLEVPVRDLR